MLATTTRANVSFSINSKVNEIAYHIMLCLVYHWNCTVRHNFTVQMKQQFKPCMIIIPVRRQGKFQSTWACYVWIYHRSNVTLHLV